MAILNSKIYLAKNIKLDSNYKNVLSYSESSMINLVTSNSIAMSNSFQFIRERSSIYVDFPYSECVEANYIAYQNPDYSNKWFFAFIDEINYKSNSSTEIKFTIDVWATWFSFWNAKTCMIFREHVNDDSVGNNTIYENFELGEYVSPKNPEKILFDPGEFYICMSVTELPSGDFPEFNNHLYNGVYSGLVYIACVDNLNMTNTIKIYDKLGKSAAINSIFMIPKEMSSIIDGTHSTWSAGGITSNVIYLSNIKAEDSIDTLIAEIPDKLGDSYIPKNNKLFTFPYSFMNLTNNSGVTVPFNYEDFVMDNGARVIAFDVRACIMPGMSMKAIPLFYKNVNVNFNNGIMLGKLPVCSWNSDVYVNWLRQNGLNTFLNIAGSVVGLGSSIATAQPLGVTASSLALAQSVSSSYNKSLTPNQASGNTNSGDINFSSRYDGGLTLYYTSIKDEFAKVVDDFFTRFGYLVNRTKIPNIHGRQFWNYIKLGDGEDMCLGQIPSNYSKIINKIGQSGVTIWHNHSNIGNFDLNNSIISE